MRQRRSDELKMQRVSRSERLQKSAERQNQKFIESKAAPTRALIVCPTIKQASSKQGRASHNTRSEEARLAEITGLAEAIDLEIVFAGIVPLARPRPATLLGTGKLEDLGITIKTDDIDLVVFDAALTPGQQRNLERHWKVKVLDRTGLILEIFGRRAQTAEGRLQVELAHLKYQKSRLVRSWTHLERQRGGFGFLGGPGETQIEADRRQINERIAKIEKQLGRVQRTRALHRASRDKVPFPVIALVGYTNAGKSTLFNLLTASNVLAEDKLFATLDPSMRGVELPSGQSVIFSDTVGFVSDLPHELVAAFRATLEEVISAEIILHVRDIAHEDTYAQSRDVRDVLSQLDISDENDQRIFEVWNKIDLVDQDRRDELENLATRSGNVALVSAVTGAGIDDLLELIDSHVLQGSEIHEVRVGVAEGRALNWLYENCDVITRIDDEDDGSIALELRVPANSLDVFHRRFVKNLSPAIAD